MGEYSEARVGGFSGEKRPTTAKFDGFENKQLTLLESAEKVESELGSIRYLVSELKNALYVGVDNESEGVSVLSTPTLEYYLTESSSKTGSIISSLEGILKGLR